MSCLGMGSHVTKNHEVTWGLAGYMMQRLADVRAQCRLTAAFQTQRQGVPKVAL